MNNLGTEYLLQTISDLHRQVAFLVSQVNNLQDEIKALKGEDADVQPKVE